ncbi:hypothetical protein N665_0468s0030 [Sinapis alba]|nr:hypothetical protein N665_0468s0030 [Sinapis alba]
MDILWAVLRYAPTVAIEIMFVLLVIMVTMLGLDILRMCLTAVTASNEFNPLEALAQVEEEQNYETSEKILRDVTEIRSKISQMELDVLQIRKIIYVLDATLSELWRLSQVLRDEGNTSSKVF